MISHLNKKNKPKIVDIIKKKKTKRIAIAEGHVVFSKKIFKKLESMQTKKGEITNISIIAGIMGAKKTSELIPLCHNIPIENIDINIETIPNKFTLLVTANVKTTYKTGVEMEALTAVCISCLTIYDMCKSLDKSILLKKIRLISKKGGKSDFN
tara:strand:+ start:2416 stop:2877 length:462 start_codon:yes stop_codon:yes gene_type:complete